MVDAVDITLAVSGVALMFVCGWYVLVHMEREENGARVPSLRTRIIIDEAV